MSAPEDFYVARPVNGMVTISYPQDWVGGVGTCREMVLVANDVSALLRPLTATSLESEEVIGEIFFLLPENMSNLGLSRNAKPTDLLNMMFKTLKSWANLRESKPTFENFTIDGKSGSAFSVHCRNCTGSQSYVIAVKTKTGYVLAAFDFRDIDIITLRNTLREVAASVEFNKMSDDTTSSNSDETKILQPPSGQVPLGGICKM